MAIVNAQLRQTYVDILDPEGNNPGAYAGAVPENKTYAITNILVCNNGSTTAQFDIHLVRQGEATDNYVTRVINNLELPAGETFTFDNEKIVLDQGDKIRFQSEPEFVDTPVQAGSFVTGKEYVITTPGTTDFTSIGASDSLIGTIFVATGAGVGSGEARTSRYTVLSATVSYLEV
jgi:hypothetical protein